MASDLISERAREMKTPPNNPSYGEKDYLHYTLARQKRSTESQAYSPSDKLVLLDEILSVAGQNRAHPHNDEYLFQNLLLKAFDHGHERFTDTELKEVFREYFSEPVLRRKRSILDHPNDPLLAENVEITFPVSDRSQGAKPKVNLIGENGEILDDPDAVILTQADIQEITKKSSLAQILEWLEDLSKGRDSNVTVLANKDKRAKETKAKDNGKEIKIETDTVRPKALRSSIEREKIENEEIVKPKNHEEPVVKESVQKHVHRSHQHKHKHHAKHHHKHHEQHKEVLKGDESSKDPLN